MLEIYTENARRAIFVARYEASAFGSPHIGTEHLLLGLLTVDPESITTLLREGESAETIRARIHERTPKQPMTSTAVDLPISEAFKQVLSNTAEESERLNHDLIGTEHLLAALLRLEDDPAARLLTEAGATLEAARGRLQEIAPEELRQRGKELNPAMKGFMENYSAGRGRA